MTLTLEELKATSASLSVTIHSVQLYGRTGHTVKGTAALLLQMEELCTARDKIDAEIYNIEHPPKG
jgi:hypothetical protein